MVALFESEPSIKAPTVTGTPARMWAEKSTGMITAALLASVVRSLSNSC